MRENSKKGFTLAELLIVIAIIAILIAIAIPVFGGQLKNARLQADHANLRSAYGLAQTVSLLGASADNIVGYDSSTLTATYSTDGQFYKTETNPVTIQAEDGEHTGKTVAGNSCATCVVDCENFDHDSRIVMVAYKSGTSGEVKANAGDLISSWHLEAEAAPTPATP